MRERVWRPIWTKGQIHGNAIYSKNETRTRKKVWEAVVINFMWLICTITLYRAVQAFRTGLAICTHWSQVMFQNSISTFVSVHLHQAPYNPSFLMRHLKKNIPSLSQKKKKKKKKGGPGVAITPPLPSSPLPRSPPTDPPQKRAKDVERWIISPRYNLTVTLRCHLLRRTALLMSSTLHVSHFPAN